MRTFKHSAVRSSVSAIGAVAVISMLAWSFETYRTYLWDTRGTQTTAAVHAETTGENATRQG